VRRRSPSPVGSASSPDRLDGAQPHDLPAAPPPELIGVTCNEVQHLFAALLADPVSDRSHRLRWSVWRRRHQQRARTCHYRQQESASSKCQMIADGVPPAALAASGTSSISDHGHSCQLPTSNSASGDRGDDWSPAGPWGSSQRRTCSPAGRAARR
jgi:hypothetical protein